MYRIAFIFLFGVSLLHAQEPTLEVAAASPTVGVGGECILTVHVRDFPALRTYGIRLSYDTTYFRCLAVEKIGYFEGYSTFYFRKIDSLQGEAGADESILGPGWTLREGGLFTMRMRALRTGVADIDFVKAQFFDSSLAAIVDFAQKGTSVTIDNSSGVGDVTPAARQLDVWPLPWNADASPLQLRVTLDRAGQAGIRVYDAAGRLVREIARGTFAPGIRQFTWNGRDSNGLPVRSGLYFAVMTTAERTLARRIIMTQ